MDEKELRLNKINSMILKYARARDWQMVRALHYDLFYAILRGDV